MNSNNFKILEQVCASTPDNHHYLIIQAQNRQTGDIVWAIGDDQVCAIASADFIRNSKINYNDVCIQEFPYRENTPESVGHWRTLIQELVDFTLRKHLEHDGFVHVYPQWLPEDAHPTMGQDLYQEIVDNIDHIILYDNNIMEMVPRRKESAMNSPSL